MSPPIRYTFLNRLNKHGHAAPTGALVSLMSDSYRCVAPTELASLMSVFQLVSFLNRLNKHGHAAPTGALVSLVSDSYRRVAPTELASLMSVFQLVSFCKKCAA
jgi:hypothetical protein